VVYSLLKFYNREDLMKNTKESKMRTVTLM